MEITDWDPKRVKADISGQVARNMDRVGDFVATQAKARVPVRTGRAQRGIDYEVRAEADVVECRVGELKGKGGAFYAYFLELGTSKMAARPFLRPSVYENASEIVAIIEGKR